jgi:hypothetical protein
MLISSTTDDYGFRARFRFPNGWGASLIQGRYTYGGDEGLWELAVIDSRGVLSYDSGITDDVMGHLTFEEVEDLLKQIEQLQPEVL